MKILTILLILLQINTFGYGNYSSPYSNRYNSYSSVPVEQTNRKIGYTTNYGNTFGYTTQQTYSGTYNPGTGSNSGKPGIRKVKGYDGNGNEIGDDSPETGHSWVHGDWNFWDDEDNYDYYWDNETKTWWRKKKGTTTWEKWNEHTGHFIIDWWDYWDWDPSTNHPSNPTHGYHENPTPIGDPDFYIITALLFSYFIYNYMKKRRQQFLLYTGIKR